MVFELGNTATVVCADSGTAALEGQMAVLAVQDNLGVDSAEVDVGIVVEFLVHTVVLVGEEHCILAGKSALDIAAAVDSQAGH